MKHGGGGSVVEGTMPGGQDAAMWALTHGSVLVSTWMRPGGAHRYNQINSLQLLSTYSVPGKVPSTSLGLTLPGNGNHFYYDPQFTNEETESHRGQEAC